MIIKEPLILNLNNISKKDRDKVGGKATNLGELIKNGFTIPKGFVLTTQGYSLFLKQNNLNEVIQNSLAKINFSRYDTIETVSKEIRDSIKNNKLPLDIIEEIKDKYDQLLSTNVAVRSSATAEDMVSASFAGQYDTYLNLTAISQVIENVKNCYASAWTSRVIAYRNENGIPQSDVKLAVIIQEMVPAKCAGILFTRNPLTLDKNEIIIESNYGLGESIASGQCSPDQFLVQKSIHRGREEFKILDKQIGKKNVAVIPKSLENEGGTVLIELSEQESSRASLSDHQILQLSQIGSQIEKSFNYSQDIEWAIDQNDNIIILQSRPITSKKIPPLTSEYYWTRGYSDDYWNDPVTPLFFDILGDQLTKVVNMELNSIMGYKRMTNKLLKLYNGHVYFNLDVLKRKVENEIPGMIRSEDVLNYFPEGHGPYGKETIKNLPFHIISRIVAELRVMVYDPDGSMSKTAKRYYEWSEEIFTPYCDKFDSQLKNLSGTNDTRALLNLAKELDDVMIKHFRLVRYGIAVHNIGMNLMVQYLFARFLGKKESSRLYPNLISGLEHKLTETNEEIHKLASFIQKTPDLKSLVLKNKSEDLHNLVKKSTDAKIQVFAKNLEIFLKNYGDRGFSREAFYPRWNEAPGYIFDILKSLVQGEIHDFESYKTKELNYRRKIEQYVHSKIRSQKFGILKWKILKIILKNSRTYIVFREDQRFNVDKWFTRNRKVYLEIGKAFKNSGILKDSNDIFFLYKKEISKIASGESGLDVPSLIEKRKDEFFKYEHAIPPKFLYGDREFDDIFRYSKESSLFKGLPASQGILTAKIRVLNKIDEISTVQPGEILVVSKTDPGWTPVFSRIGGLITETGGVLSHGAVVSREYGIPAVINIPNACKLFKTEQVVTINGYNGTVVLKK